MLLIAVLMVWQDRSLGDIIPILTLFAMATVRLMPSVQQLISMYTNLRYNLVTVDPVYSDLKELEDFNSRFVEDRKKMQLLKFKSEIEIRNVSYRYPGSDTDALQNI